MNELKWYLATLIDGTALYPLIVGPAHMRRFAHQPPHGALAIWFDELIPSGEAQSYEELARIGHVSRAGVTQIMDLLNLAPSLQERFLVCDCVIDTERTVRNVIRWIE